jgi:hypothetical protein
MGADVDPTFVESVRKLFSEHGVAGEIRVAEPPTLDEVIFVLSAEAAATMNERELTIALTDHLRRKVWVTTDGPQWQGRTEPLS